MIEEKSCTSRVKKLAGTYRFRIEGFSTIPNRNGESVESPEFFLCNHTWQLRIFPGGSLEQHKGYLSYYLASKSNRVARASYKLSIVNQQLGGEDETFTSTAIRVFEPKGEQVDGWGRDRFILADMLNDPDFGLCVNDSVVFKVDLTVYGELEPVFTNDGKQSKELQQKNCLEGSLQQIFNDESTSDVKIYVGKENEEKKVIFAHRCILIARSEVFNLMFSSMMRESITGEIVIDDFEYPVIFSMIFYMYTDISPDKNILPQHCVSLLKACKKYQLLSLGEICESYLTSCLQISSCLSMLRFAYDLDCFLLKQKCLLYIAEHSQKVRVLQEFNELETDLLKEVTSTIETFNKRKGCKKLYDKKSKYSVSCQIM